MANAVAAAPAELTQAWSLMVWTPGAAGVDPGDRDRVVQVVRVTDALGE